MKILNRKSIIIAIISVMVLAKAEAKVWRLNNNNGIVVSLVPIVSADFTGTLQAAHDDASVASGDTIQVDQSTLSYGNCVFTKKLVLIGSGYFLDKNTQTQIINGANTGSKIGTITFYNSASAGSVITGVQMGTCYIGVNDITIARCYVPAQLIIGSNVANTDLTGIKILQNYLNVGGWAISIAGTGGNLTAQIYGNLFTGTSGITGNARLAGIIKNNTFNCSSSPMNVQGFTISSNISQSLNLSSNTFTNCMINNNIGNANNQFVSPSGAGNTLTDNLTKTDAEIAFIGGTSTDGKFKLGAGSAGIGTGESGINCGAYDGPYPYKLSGIPAVPNNYGLTIGAVSAGAATINVTLNARANN